MDRWFKAVDAKTGKLLWQFHAPSGIIGQPITYQGNDGKQYVAMLSGVGGWAGAIAAAEIDPRVRNGALGFVGATQDLAALYGRRQQLPGVRLAEGRAAPKPLQWHGAEPCGGEVT